MDRLFASPHPSRATRLLRAQAGLRAVPHQLALSVEICCQPIVIEHSGVWNSARYAYPSGRNRSYRASVLKTVQSQLDVAASVGVSRKLCIYGQVSALKSLRRAGNEL